MSYILQVIYHTVWHLAPERPQRTIQTTVYSHPSSYLILQAIKQIRKTPFIFYLPPSTSTHNIYHQNRKAASRPCSGPTILRLKGFQPRPLAEGFRVKDLQRDPAPPRHLFSQFMCTLQRIRYGKIDTVYAKKKINPILITNFY